MLTLPGVARAAKPDGAPLPPAATATATAAAGLTDARRQTYRALIDTVVTEPGLRVDPATADAAASEFAGAYAAWPAERRAQADRVLDTLEGSTGRSFAGMDRGGRAQNLRAFAKPTDDQPIGAERARLDLAQDALSLAVVTVGPSGGELDRPL